MYILMRATMRLVGKFPPGGDLWVHFAAVLYNWLAYLGMRCPAAITLALLASVAGVAQQPQEHTITLNIQYRVNQGGLPKLGFGIERPRNVEVIEGGEELLQSCLNDSATWTEDPFLFRLAHTHAASSQSCRENRSPSLHAIFRKVPGEPLHVWMHLDGHGSRTLGIRMVHLGEVLYHKITFQNNDQDRMFENLERSFSRPLSTSPAEATPLDAGNRLMLFTDKTVTQVRLATYGIQSGAAAALHEDLRYRPSLSRNLWRRSGRALLSPDLALANIVAAVGSGKLLSSRHVEIRRAKSLRVRRSKSPEPIQTRYSAFSQKQILTWRTRSCVPRSHSCERLEDSD